MNLQPCCAQAIELATDECLDDFSEGMADPELKSFVAAAAQQAVRDHDHRAVVISSLALDDLTETNKRLSAEVERLRDGWRKEILLRAADHVEIRRLQTEVDRLSRALSHS